MIFCTQYKPGDWYERLHPNSEERSAIAEAILDRIVHNAYEVLIDRSERCNSPSDPCGSAP